MRFFMKIDPKSIYFEETYSPVTDAITFRFLMKLAASKIFKMHLMNIVTAYLKGSLDYIYIYIYMKIPKD